MAPSLGYKDPVTRSVPGLYPRLHRTKQVNSLPPYNLRERQFSLLIGPRYLNTYYRMARLTERSDAQVSLTHRYI